jgi:hypothetical protein
MKDQSITLLDEVKGMHDILSSSPTEVEPFVEKVAMLATAQEALPSLRERLDHIKAMGRIMDNNEWPVPDTQKALFKMLGDGLSALEASVQSTEEHLDSDTKRFAEDVEARIPVLKADLLTLRESLDDPMVSDAEADVDAVVKYIQGRQDTFTELSERAQKYQHWQQMLQQPIQDFEALDEVRLDLMAKQKLWVGLQEWLAMTAEWSGADFTTIDAEDLGLKIQVYNKTAVRSDRALPGNGAAARLRVLVEEFKAL